MVDSEGCGRDRLAPIAQCGMYPGGDDAVILIWDAKAKQVVSINAEGTAPKLATID